MARINHRIAIFKPGTVLAKRFGKTNLQIHELLSLRSRLASALPRGFSNDVAFWISISETIEHTLDSDIVFVFCHANTMRNMFDDFLESLEMSKTSKSLIFISNDVRLPFETDLSRDKVKRCLAKHNVYLWTNASTDLAQYRRVGFPFLDGIKTKPVEHKPLHVLALTPGSTRTCMPIDKRDMSCFFGMHFQDYDENRREILSGIHESMSAAGLTYDEYGDMPGSVGVVDASIVPKLMNMYAYTPVVLEKGYEYFGVLPNRVSEALASGCLPIFVVKDAKEFTRIAKQYYNTTYAEMVSEQGVVTQNFAKTCLQLSNNPKSVQDLVERQLSLVNIDLAQFEKDLINLVEQNIAYESKE